MNNEISKFVKKEISFYDILKDEKRAQLFFENNQVYFATPTLIYQFKNDKFSHDSFIYDLLTKETRALNSNDLTILNKIKDYLSLTGRQVNLPIKEFCDFVPISLKNNNKNSFEINQDFIKIENKNKLSFEYEIENTFQDKFGFMRNLKFFAKKIRNKNDFVLEIVKDFNQSLIIAKNQNFNLLTTLTN